MTLTVVNFPHTILKFCSANINKVQGKTSEQGVHACLLRPVKVIFERWVFTTALFLHSIHTLSILYSASTQG